MTFYWFFFFSFYPFYYSSVCKNFKKFKMKIENSEYFPIVFMKMNLNLFFFLFSKNRNFFGIFPAVRTYLICHDSNWRLLYCLALTWIFLSRQFIMILTGDYSIALLLLELLYLGIITILTRDYYLPCSNLNPFI